MSCRICKNRNCIPSFHSLEEQRFFEPVIDAYEYYDDTKEQNKQLINETDDEDEINKLQQEIDDALESARELRDEYIELNNGA